MTGMSASGSGGVAASMRVMAAAVLGRVVLISVVSGVGVVVDAALFGSASHKTQRRGWARWFLTRLVSTGNIAMVGTELGMARWQSVIADGSISIERARSLEV
jgi:hypothetical protein